MRDRLFYSPTLLIFILPFILSQSTPIIPKCEGDLKPVFLLQHNVTNGVQIRVVPAANFLDCSEICARSNDCVAVEFANGVCTVIGESEVAFVSENESAPLITKSCVKSQRVCASPFHFDVHEQKILVGFAREVVPAESLQICLSACLNAFDTFGFECESVMYYPIDSECILNTEDRLDRPDLFVDEHEDTVIYLDNNCAGSQCYAPYITQYIAVEDSQLHNELDRQFADLDLESCEELCTHRLTVSRDSSTISDDTTTSFLNCKSFMYNNQTRTCILSDERSTPLGRGRLTDAKGFTYYEKKCFASPRTCRNVPSFTRVPQMILVGFAAFVMENVPSVTMCLDQCTNPPPETGEKFVCKSVMYYYNEQECILNAETRHTKPDLFIPEGEEFQVDYFDITCHLEREECVDGRQLHSVRTLNAALPEGDGSLHVIESTGKTASECLSKCYEMAPEKCRSFNFDKESGLCNLLYLDGKTTLRPQIKKGIDLYDMHCLAPPNSCPLKTNGALFSRYLYSKQPGLPSDEKTVTSLTKCLDLCSELERCEGVNYNRRNGQCSIFEQIEENVEKHEHVDFYKNLCQVKEVDNGASSASNVPSTEFKASSNKTLSLHSSLNTTAASEKVDTRAEILETKIVKSALREKEHNRVYSGNSRVSQSSSSNSVANNNAAQASLSIGTASGSAAASNLAPSVLIPADSVHTICNYEGIKVQIKNSEPFSGVVFVKNKYDTCRVEVEFSDSATLVLGLPKNFGMKPIVLNAAANVEVEQAGSSEGGIESAADGLEASVSENEVRRRRETARECGLIDMDNGKYKTTVVVQTNNLGIPGLVTSMDQLYEISCDYSSMLGGKITTAANLTVHGPEASLIQPRGKIELGNPVLMQMNAGDGGHQPIIQAKLGDILELRWEIMAMDEELDFFVKDCVAEPGGSEKRNDETLQLIQDGCPTPAVAQKLIPNPIQVQSSAVKIAHLQAFRFDSSSSVRITCHLEICKGDCQPVSCNLKNGAQQSWGRKKRSDNSITMFETRRYKVPRFAQATTSLVVVDPLQQINEPSATVALSRHTPIINFTRADPPISVQKVSTPNQMCVNKFTLSSVLGTLLVLILVQAVVVSRYIFRRLWGSSKSY